MIKIRRLYIFEFDYYYSWASVSNRTLYQNFGFASGTDAILRLKQLPTVRDNNGLKLKISFLLEVWGDKSTISLFVFLHICFLL